MSEEDNFENLSNAEIRAKCIEQGLPNVPVTDSSRKVLIKKLRVSLGGGSNSPSTTASPKKAAARRETVHAARQLLAEKTDSQEAASGSDAEQKEIQRGRGRRTISATPPPLDRGTSSKESSPAPGSPEVAGITERRRSTREQVLTKATGERRIEPLAVLEEVEGEKQTAAPARVQQRRSSAQPDERPLATRIPQRREAVIQEEERELPTRKAQQPPPLALSQESRTTKRHYLVELEQPAQPLQAIVNPIELAPITQRRSSSQSRQLQPEPIRENTLRMNSLVIVESDDEEDLQLSRAAQEAEDRSKQEKEASAFQSMSSYGVGSDYYRKTLHTGGGVKDTFSARTVAAAPTASYLSSTTTSISGIGAGLGASRFGSSGATSYFSPASRSGFTLSSAISAASSPYSRSSSNIPQRGSVPPCGNEFSDDNENDNDVNSESDRMNTPYLSAFTRNLERWKRESLFAAGEAGNSGLGTAWQRRSIAGSTRRPIRRGDQVDVASALLGLWHHLVLNYMPSAKVFAFVIFTLLIILYLIFF